ncbi:hypothetical protein BGZ93_011206 [Podila epicladia]|nr:hypothetical protein BGZ92_003805 [Podila epicladia]KAG0098528.1 hypothetical protein BGZ93_011206 [Podila epicladia]
MGSFSNFRSFLSNHILSNNQSQSQSQSHDQQKQQKASLDDRSLHSFNPHYQHNLHSTAYSTPPSLASSPTNSSPTSTTSSSSNPSYNKARYGYSTVNSKGVKSPPQHSQQYFPRRSYYHQQQIQQQQLLQQQQNSRQHHQHRSNNGHQYQQNRRSYRNHHNQACLYEEDELSLGSSSTATAMDLASPIDPSPLSVSMWQGRRRPAQQQQQQQGQTSHILVFRASETEKHASRASSKRSPPSVSRPRSTAHPTKHHSSADQYQYLSSSPFTISESRASTAVSYMQDVDVSDGVDMPSSAASSSSSSSSSASRDKMDAKTSLMRIAQCGRHEDSWCSLQSGQYTRHYAESRSGVTVDGRRARRM